MLRNSRIFRYINRNLGKIIAIFIVIIFILLLIQVANHFAKQKVDKPLGNSQTTNQNVYKPEDTVIIGSDVSEQTQETNTNLIQTFVQFCTEGNVGQAYSMLSEECKKNMYADIETFRQNYYDKIFTTKREISIQSWINEANIQIYKVKYLNNALAEGKIDDNNVYEDYITIVKDDISEKLNIGGFIKTEQLNRTAEQNGIKITALYRASYMTYERYFVKIENNTQNSIFLDSKQRTDSIYIIGTNGSKWEANSNSINSSLLEIKPSLERIYSIEFIKAYNPNLIVKSFVFSDIREKEIINEENKRSISVDW